MRPGTRLWAGGVARQKNQVGQTDKNRGTEGHCWRADGFGFCAPRQPDVPCVRTCRAPGCGPSRIHVVKSCRTTTGTWAGARTILAGGRQCPCAWRDAPHWTETSEDQHPTLGLLQLNRSTRQEKSRSRAATRVHSKSVRRTFSACTSHVKRPCNSVSFKVLATPQHSKTFLKTMKTRFLLREWHPEYSPIFSLVSLRVRHCTVCV